MAKLTPKQEKFCQSIVSGLNQTDAYRSAYCCDNMADATVSNEAYKTMQNPQIAARIDALRLPIAERIGMDFESYLRETLVLKNIALSSEDNAQAIKAHELLGKALGFYVNKTEVSGSLDLNVMFDDIAGSDSTKVDI